MVEGKKTAIEVVSDALMAFGTTLLSFLVWPCALIALGVGIYKVVKKACSEEGLTAKDKWEIIAFLTLALIASLVIRNPALATKIEAERTAVAWAKAWARATKGIASDATTLTKAERLNLIFKVLKEAPGAKNAEEAMQQMNKTLDAVEDAYSGVKKNSNPGKEPDGRISSAIRQY